MTKNIRIVAPSGSIANKSLSDKEQVKEIFHRFNTTVSYGAHTDETDAFYSSKIASRLSDIHEAFKDNTVQFIQAASGGSNSNQLLDYIDYNLIKKNPKPFLGQSDTTALLNAIYAQTGVITYHGPHFTTLLKNLDSEYTQSWLEAFLNQSDCWLDVKPSPFYGDKKNHTTKNEGYQIINQGSAKGKIIGGNLPTLTLLQGTRYWPDLTDKILFIEYDGMVGEFVPEEFDRDLMSLLQQKNSDKIKALVLGRFTSNSNMDFNKLKSILSTKPILNNIPVIAGVDFGHTNPLIIFPIGGDCMLDVTDSVSLKIKLF